MEIQKGELSPETTVKKFLTVQKKVSEMLDDNWIIIIWI